MQCTHVDKCLKEVVLQKNISFDLLKKKQEFTHVDKCLEEVVWRPHADKCLEVVWCTHADKCLEEVV